MRVWSAMICAYIWVRRKSNLGMNAFLPWDVNALWQSLDPKLMRRRRIPTNFNIACIYDSKSLSSFLFRGLGLQG